MMLFDMSRGLALRSWDSRSVSPRHHYGSAGRGARICGLDRN